jgi:uncharacterized protein YdcH (DUF465 family)
VYKVYIGEKVAKLYTIYVNGNTYFFVNYFDPEKNKTAHMYIGSPDSAINQLKHLTKIADVWNELDETSKKKFIEGVQEVDNALTELKKKINIKD